MKASSKDSDASSLIDERIGQLGDWRGQMLQRVRRIIRQADRRIVEEWKWRTPVWSCGGIICTGETYKNVVKLTFAHGASLKDPLRLFNSSLEGNVRRAIDIHEGEKIDAAALKDLVRAAIELNLAGRMDRPPVGKGLASGRTPPTAKTSANAKTQANAKTRASAKTRKKPGSRANTKTPMNASAKSWVRKDAKRDRSPPRVKLLSGGNPQIARADGNSAVQAYIAAMPGWKRDVGERLDALIERSVPGVRKAVRWNTPFYGVRGAAGASAGWFMAFHCMTNYVKVTFFRGGALRPVPPVESKRKEVRYAHLLEHDTLDAPWPDWIRQAARLPGSMLF